MKWLVPLILFAGVAHADTAAFDAQMAPLAAHYLVIHGALFEAGEGDMDAAAKGIEAGAAKLNAKAVTGEHAGHYAELPAKIGAAAKAFRAAPDVKAKREAFKALSKPFAMWVTMSKPSGLSVGYCPMVKASWIQKGTRVLNPYEPKTMPHCGQIVGGEMPPASAPTK